MDYQETVTKLSELERKLMPDIEKLQEEGKLPHGLKIAKDEILEWEDAIDGKDGLRDTPTMKPVRDFARELEENKDLFASERQDNIAEYRVLAAELPEVWDDPLG